MAEVILIGCRLPHGLTLRHPVEKDETVTLKGTNTGPTGNNGARVIIPYATTPVDADFWTTWKAAYLDYQPLKTGAIFEARTETEAASKAKNLQKVKTGFEPMAQSSGGVKKADK